MTFWKTGEEISANPSNPPAGLQVPEVSINPLSGAVTQNFYALATGDFNRSFIPDMGGKSASKTLHLEYDRHAGKQGYGV